jgi:hypothetical protein
MEIAIYILLGTAIGIAVTLIITNSKKLTYAQSEKEAAQQKYNDLAKEYEAYKAHPSTEVKSTKSNTINLQNDKISLDDNGLIQTEKKFTKESKQLVHKNAYEKWATEEDEKLELFFCEGKTISELS